MKPGCGAIVAAIEEASRRKPDHESGKPSTLMLQMIAEAEHLDPEEILVIGDGIESDLAMAANFGSPWVLIGKPDGPDTPIGPAFGSLAECVVVLSDSALVAG